VPQTDAIFARMTEVLTEADAADDVLRVSLDAKATVKVGPFARGGKSRVGVQAADHAARLTRACRTVQPDKHMAYLLTVLENSMAGPPAAAVTPAASSGHGRWGHAASPASPERQGISRYIGGSYGVCEHCLSSPCEADCPTRTHDVAGPGAPLAPGAVPRPRIAPDSYASC